MHGSLQPCLSPMAWGAVSWPAVDGRGHFTQLCCGSLNSYCSEESRRTQVLQPDLMIREQMTWMEGDVKECSSEHFLLPTRVTSDMSRFCFSQLFFVQGYIPPRQ